MNINLPMIFRLFVKLKKKKYTQTISNKTPTKSDIEETLLTADPYDN